MKKLLAVLLGCLLIGGVVYGADQWNDNKPAVGNQISADIPDIEENFGWLKRLVQMNVGWKDTTIANVGPPLQRAVFAWTDTDTISIGVGSYFHDGAVRQALFWDEAIAFDFGSTGSNAASENLDAAAWERHYIYIDDSAVTTLADTELVANCFLNTTTAPSWSVAKHGWYNGSDRCIFAVWVNNSNEVVEFFHNGDRVTLADELSCGKTAVTDFDYSAVDVDAAGDIVFIPMPAFAVHALVYFHANANSDSNTCRFYWKTQGQTGTTGTRVSWVDADSITIHGNSTVVTTDSSNRIGVYASTNGDHQLTVLSNGWLLPVGL